MKSKYVMRSAVTVSNPSLSIDVIFESVPRNSRNVTPHVMMIRRINWMDL